MKDRTKEYLSLGYLCDPNLIKSVKAYRAKLSRGMREQVPMAYVVRVVLRRGLEGL